MSASGKTFKYVSPAFTVAVETPDSMANVEIDFEDILSDVSLPQLRLYVLPDST